MKLKQIFKNCFTIVFPKHVLDSLSTISFLICVGFQYKFVIFDYYTKRYYNRLVRIEECADIYSEIHQR